MRGVQLPHNSSSVAGPTARVAASLAGALALVAMMAGCHHRDPQVRYQPSDGTAWRAMIDRCEPGEPVRCPADVFRDGVRACIDDWEAARAGEVELRRCRELASVGEAEMRGTIDILRDTIERLRSQRWIWGAIGVAVGAILAGVVVGAAAN